VLAGRGQPRIDEVACSVRAETQNVHLLAIATDVSSESQVDRLFREATATFGRVDVLVHCAGVLGPIINLGESVVEDWWNAFVGGPRYAVARPKLTFFRTGNQCKGCLSSRQTDGSTIQQS
jgi:NAD(P)-dependent dehydrogenase (short-subunit alcohol dehydrogenase family)